MYNKVILVGRLTRDIELRYSQSGAAIGNASIATNHNYTSNGEKKEEVCYTDITFFGRSGEIANQYLHKGSQILVEGRLKFDQWVDQNGQKKSKHSVVVETMKMLDTKGSGQATPAPQQAQDYVAPTPSYEQHPDYPKTTDMQQKQQASMDQEIPEIDITEDEIPF